MLKSEQQIEKFAKSCKEFVDTNNFDGIDLDFEWPGKDEKHQFTLLVKTVRKYMKEKILTNAFAVGNAALEGYDLKELEKYLDNFHLMTYDLKGIWNRRLGFHTDIRLIKEKAEYFLSKGIPRHKIFIGLSEYGRAFGTSLHKFKPNDFCGKCLTTKWFYTFAEICELLTNGWTYSNDSLAKSSYVYSISDNIWIGFDSIDDINDKIEYIKSEKFGAMIWEITQDDFENKCNRGFMPILNSVASLMDTSEKSNTRLLPMNGSSNNIAVNLYFLGTLLLILELELN
ncbi:DgyrCDS7086 [Dimorphilus gyrociliatus]|uniref:DgyrCDS7086 n=1 Tax=Dimorphilus gyrociliatus TaxID=2664684 RepID=A0A7I8VQ57_9ANNE|nr:DgyrCDS7086 [Dimorphilus gyrociliatus]